MQQSATSAQDMDQIQSEPRKDDVDVEKQAQALRFEDEEEHEEENVGHGAERPRVDTSMEGVRKPHRHTPNTPGKQSVLHGAHVKDLDPAADRLAEDLTPLTPVNFYKLMGLNPPDPDEEQDLKRLMKPNGLYAKIVKGANYTNRKYHAFAIAVYVFLVLQLVISAVFIILGSLRHVDTHITIAVLGAVSTVIAGGLALMQGQGLPNRLRQTRDALRDVIFAAEELCDDMKTGHEVFFKDVKKIREDYLRVLEDQRQNNPDMWQAASVRNIEQGVGRAPKEVK